MKSKIFLIILLSVIIHASNILTFSQAYKLALAKANKIKYSYYQYKAVKERINQEIAALYPQIKLSLSIGRESYSFNRDSFRLRYNVHGITKSATISLSQVVYDKEIQKRIEEAKIRANIYKIKNSITKQDFVNEILNDYIEILKSKNRIMLLNNYIKYYKTLLQANKSKFNMNLITENEVLDVEVKLNDTYISIEKEKELINAYKESLKLLIKRDNIKLPVGDFKYFNLNKIDKMLHVVKNIKHKNLEYLEAIENIHLSKTMLDEAKSAKKPKVYLQARYTKYANADKLNNYKNSSSIALTMSMSLYDGGLIKSRIEEAKYNLLSSLANAKDIKNSKKIEYKKELANFKAIMSSLKLYKKSYDSLKIHLTSIQKGLKEGLYSIVDLNNAQVKLDEMKFQYTQNMYELIKSYTKLLILTNNMKNIYLIDKILR